MKSFTAHDSTQLLKFMKFIYPIYNKKKEKFYEKWQKNLGNMKNK